MGIRGHQGLQKVLSVSATILKLSLLMALLAVFKTLHFTLDKLATGLHQYVTPRLDSFNQYLRGKLNAGRTQRFKANTAKQG